MDSSAGWQGPCAESLAVPGVLASVPGVPGGVPRVLDSIRLRWRSPRPLLISRFTSQSQSVNLSPSVPVRQSQSVASQSPSPVVALYLSAVAYNVCSCVSVSIARVQYLAVLQAGVSDGVSGDLADGTQAT